eukprot:scaffold26528_cov57-Phaeocystis_antarctica.AAC.1
MVRVRVWAMVTCSSSVASGSCSALEAQSDRLRPRPTAASAPPRPWLGLAAPRPWLGLAPPRHGSARLRWI